MNKENHDATVFGKISRETFVEDVDALGPFLEGAVIERLHPAPMLDLDWIKGRTELHLILRRPDGSRFSLKLFVWGLLALPICGELLRLPSALQEDVDLPCGKE
jgi:hypothetical protein